MIQRPQQLEPEGGESNANNHTKFNAKKVLPRTFFLFVMLVAVVMSNLTYSKFTSTQKASSMYTDKIQEANRTLHLLGGLNESLGVVASHEEETEENGQEEENSATSKETVETHQPTEESVTAISIATETPAASSATEAEGETQASATTTTKAAAAAAAADTTTKAPYEHLMDGAFIHLGKTGGSALAGFMRNGCHSFAGRPCPNHPITNSTNETAASLKVQHYYHVPDFPSLGNATVHDFYIVTLRDPYERIRSGVVYSHPANEKTLIRSGAMRYPAEIWIRLWKQHGKNMTDLTKCFPTLEQVVQNLGDGNQIHNYNYPVGPEEIYQENCTDFARALIDHKVRAFPHLYWNLEHIYEKMGHAMNQTVIFASRKEHIVQDWEATNKLLGEPKDTTQLWPRGKKRDVSKTNLPVPNELSEEGRVQLCRALRGEYLRHVEFLQASVNVSPEDKEQYLGQSRKNCGDQLEFLNVPLSDDLASDSTGMDSSRVVEQADDSPKDATKAQSGGDTTVAKEEPSPTDVASGSTTSINNAPYANLNDGAFIHLGKTGGSSLAGFMRNACHSFVGRPCPNKHIANSPNETAVSLKMQHYYHVPDFPSLGNATVHDFYIVTMRDPYERIRSSVIYSHPANERKLIRSGALRYPAELWKKLRKQHGNSMAKLTKCFPTLEQFVQNLGDGNEVHNYTYPVGTEELYQEDCTHFARALIDHKVRAFPHLYWNLEHIYDKMGHAMNQTVIFASRKEHIVQDWEATNKLLGESKDTTKLWPRGKRRDVSKLKLPVANALSEEGRVQLCRALRGEYLRHVEFLQASVNVSPEDKEEYLGLSRKNCGDQLEFL